MFVISNTAGAGGIHIRYALYRLIVDGLHRQMAAIAPAVTIPPYTRHFDWYNGNPFWSDAANVRYPGVNSVVRTFAQDNTSTWRWQWVQNGVWKGWCARFF
jgi:hypothetical protein